MAFNYDIRNLKDCKDFKSKRQEFFSLLRLQAKLNRNYEQATIAREQMDQMGITPVMQARRSLEDERKDLVMQQQLAMRNLQTLMKDEEAQAVILGLSEEDIYFLNSEFGKISEFLAGRTNISSEFFKRVLHRFKVYLDSTGRTGIPIPLRESTIEKLPGDLRDEWESYTRQHVDPTTGTTPDLDELLRRTADATSRSYEDVKMEVDDEVKMEVEQEPPADADPEPFTMGKTTPRKPGRRTFSKRTLGIKKPMEMGKRMAEFDVDEEPPVKRQKTRKRAPIVPTDDGQFQEDYVPYDFNNDSVPINPNTGGVKRGREVVPDLPEKRAKFENESALMRGVKRKTEYAIDYNVNKYMKTGMTKDQAIRLAKQELAQRMEAYQPPSRPFFSERLAMAEIEPERRRVMKRVRDEAEEHSRKRRPETPLQMAKREAREGIVLRAEMRARELGQGLIISPQRTTSDYGATTHFSTLNLHGGKLGMPIRKHGKVVGKIGSGIMSNADLHDVLRKFGKYCLHMPSLHKSFVNIKYASGKVVPSIPQKYVSADFVKLVMKVLDDKKMDKKVFHKLSDDEQQYFCLIARKCDFDSVIGLGMSKATSQDEQKEQDRFEMLRGTIIAGNNSPEVLKEMKMFILKFINDKRLPKQQGHDLLYEIACLT